MTDATIATWFRPVLSAADRAVLLDLVARTDAALRGLGVDYVVYGGALLGFCADGDLLSWDDDVDLLVLDAVPPADLAARLAAALPDLRVCPHMPQLLKVCRPPAPDSGRAWSFPFVDVGFMYASNGRWCHDSMWGGTDVYPADEITPTQRGSLAGVEVSVPARAADACRRTYGPDCLTGAVPPQFDHRALRPTGFPKVRVPLARITRALRRESSAPSADPRACVVLVPSGRVVDQGFEDALAELGRRGYAVRRVRQEVAPPGFRDRMVADALAAGFREVLLLDPAVTFAPADVETLRARGLPVVCGVYPAEGRAGLACEFPPGTAAVRLGAGGGLVPVLGSRLGFALVRRAVFEAVVGSAGSKPEPTYFATAGTDGGPVDAGAEDVAFCRRARAAGFDVVADTTIRLWRTEPARRSWEEAGGDRPRQAGFTFRVRGAEPPAVPPPRPAAGPPDDPHPQPERGALRVPAAPLPPGFPRVGLFVVTYPANADSLALTLASVRASDWGEEPVVVTQPADWPVGRETGARTYGQALRAAAASGCDFALILEDDVRVGRHLRHNVLANPLVARDQCDYLGLFVPDLIADPWERAEPHLGYRLAKPRYAGPDRGWERSRVWGAQGYLLSRRLMAAAAERWDRLTEGQDSRMLAVCAELRVPLWYTAPCLVEHAPVRSAFGTPDARAPDFDPDFRLEVGAGFQPPEAVPGWLTRPEAELLWRTAAGRGVLELGTRCGRSTVCLGQSAEHVAAVDVADQSEAAEWARRFGVRDKIEFRRGDAAAVCGTLSGPFDLAFIDTLHDAASVARDIAAALPLLAPGGRLAFHDYPDPGWPDVRKVVDEHAARLGWRRVAQADFLGVFQT